MSKTRAIVGSVLAVAALTLLGVSPATATNPKVSAQDCKRGGGDVIWDADNSILSNPPTGNDYNPAWCRGGEFDGWEILH
ncbi:hypothetical protein ACWIGW_38890 [Nocardia brasiliensis]